MSFVQKAASGVVSDRAPSRMPKKSLFSLGQPPRARRAFSVRPSQFVKTFNVPPEGMPPVVIRLRPSDTFLSALRESSSDLSGKKAIEALGCRLGSSAVC